MSAGVRRAARAGRATGVGRAARTGRRAGIAPRACRDGHSGGGGRGEPPGRGRRYVEQDEKAGRRHKGEALDAPLGGGAGRSMASSGGATTCPVEVGVTVARALVRDGRCARPRFRRRPPGRRGDDSVLAQVRPQLPAVGERRVAVRAGEGEGQVLHQRVTVLVTAFSSTVQLGARIALAERLIWSALESSSLLVAGRRSAVRPPAAWCQREAKDRQSTARSRT